MKKTVFLSVILLAGLAIFPYAPCAGAEAPTLALKSSLPMAEAALANAKIDLSNYYLYAIIYSRSSKGDYWYYTYRPNSASEYGQVFVKVYMTGETEVIGGPEARQRY